MHRNPQPGWLRYKSNQGDAAAGTECQPYLRSPNSDLRSTINPHAFSAFASGERQVRHIIVHDFIAVREKRRQVLNREREGRTFFARIELTLRPGGLLIGVWYINPD